MGGRQRSLQSGAGIQSQTLRQHKVSDFEKQRSVVHARERRVRVPLSKQRLFDSQRTPVHRAGFNRVSEIAADRRQIVQSGRDLEMLRS